MCIHTDAELAVLSESHGCGHCVTGASSVVIMHVCMHVLIIKQTPPMCATLRIRCFRSSTHICNTIVTRQEKKEGRQVDRCDWCTKHSPP